MNEENGMLVKFIHLFKTLSACFVLVIVRSIGTKAVTKTWFPPSKKVSDGKDITKNSMIIIEISSIKEKFSRIPGFL